MARFHLTHRGGAAAVVMVLLVLGGCGGSHTADSSKDAASASAGPSGSTSPSATSSEIPTPANHLKALSADDFYSAVYKAQKKAGSYHFTLSTGAAGGITGEGDADTSGAQPAAHATVNGPSGKVESIVKDGLLYVKAPGLGTAKQWLKIDPTDKSGLGALAGQLGGNSDPGKFLGALKHPARFKATGEQKVQGVPTTRYLISVDSKKVFKALGFPKKLAASASLPKTFDYQVWVDGKNRPVKTVQSLEINKKKITTTIVMSKYGEQVSIKAPPADETSTKLPPTAGT